MRKKEDSTIIPRILARAIESMLPSTKMRKNLDEAGIRRTVF